MSEGRSRRIAVVVLVALWAAACGGGADDEGSADPTDGGDPTGEAVEIGPCDWASYGNGPQRRFALADGCDTAIGTDTVGDLTEAWFFNTDDVVTATPAVAGGSVFVGDWAGTFYAIDAETGEERWRHTTDPHPTVYSGQIVSSAAVADVDGRSLVYFGGGKTLYALDAATGEEVWAFDTAVFDLEDEHDVDATTSDDQRPTEIQSSPLVVDGKVIVGFDAHDRPGFRAGVIAVDAATGELVWDFDPDQGAEPTGCGGVWSSPSADLERGLVFAASANCNSAPEGWGEYTEALFALDLDTGEPQWSFQPHPPNNNDIDLPGSPNLFDVGDVAAVGIGSKDGHYYAVDRETGEALWDAEGKEPDIEEGSNYSFGGFIGPLAVADGLAVGGTAGNGPTACPCLHAFDVETGEVAWQAEEPQPIFGASAIAGGVVFSGGTDFTFRALDLADGEVLWSTDMPGVVAGGSAIVGDDVFAVAGIREPGGEVTAESAGVFRFTLDADAAGDPTAPTTDTTVEAYDGPVVLESPDQPCIGSPCDAQFTTPTPPAGLTPAGTLELTIDPFSVRMTVTGLGDPERWVAPNAPNADDGADVFTLMISVSDENPLGDALCTFEPTDTPGELRCEGDTIPLLAPQYNRLTILALPEGAGFPSVAEGVARLVWTRMFDTPLVLVDPPPPPDTSSTTAP
jgi:outer membrane protein assembly factor BamB